MGRSNNNANANGGVVFANTNNASSRSNTNIGSRLANRKELEDITSKIVPTAYRYEIAEAASEKSEPQQ